MAAIGLSFAAFAAGSFGGAAVFYSRLFGLGQGAKTLDDFLYWGRSCAPYLACGVVFATPLPKKLWLSIRKYRWVDVGLFLIFWACVYVMATSSGDPFMYLSY